MRILHIEDDPATAKSVQLMLKSDGFVCDTTDSGEDGLEVGKLYDYDLIILDIMLPDVDGYEVLRRLRGARVKTPIIVLTGLKGLEYELKSLGLGADDHMTKPFDKRVLVARVQAVIRRSRGHSQSVIKTGKLTVNLDTRTVDVDGRELHLTGKEYGIIELLSMRKGKTLTKEMFLNHLYGGLDEPELKIVDVFICKLRKKIERAAGENYIETVWGRGYFLSDTARPPQNRRRRQNGKRPSPTALPSPDTRRWVIKRKAAVVAAVRAGDLPLAEAQSLYNISAEEFLGWERLVSKHGVQGLRVTKLQEYRGGGKGGPS